MGGRQMEAVPTRAHRPPALQSAVAAQGRVQRSAAGASVASSGTTWSTRGVGAGTSPSPWGTASTTLQVPRRMRERETSSTTGVPPVAAAAVGGPTLCSHPEPHLPVAPLAHRVAGDEAARHRRSDHRIGGAPGGRGLRQEVDPAQRHVDFLPVGRWAGRGNLRHRGHPLDVGAGRARVDRRGACSGAAGEHHDEATAYEARVHSTADVAQPRMALTPSPGR